MVGPVGVLLLHLGIFGISRARRSPRGRPTRGFPPVSLAPLGAAFVGAVLELVKGSHLKDEVRRGFRAKRVKVLPGGNGGRKRMAA